MSGRCVCDASAVVTMLLDSGSDGRWATEELRGRDLCAPELMPIECANVIRRLELGAIVGADQSRQAHADLLDLVVESWPYDVLAHRVWELRGNLSSYDAAYVALAEALDVPLVTLDSRIARAPGIECTVILP